MPLTITTIENLTTITGSGGPTAVFTPSRAGDNRYRIRVVRVVASGTVALTDSVLFQGITNTGDDSGITTETQTLYLATPPGTTAFETTTSFPDEAEWRGKINCTITTGAGVYTVFLYHG